MTVSPFFIAKHECSQAQWAALSWGERPSHFSEGKGADRRPVEQISWEDCVRVLGEHGLGLPTEAQWEYACRAGTTTPWWTGPNEEDLAEAAWYATNVTRSTHAVAEKRANPFGLHDAHGNVWEWCRDVYGNGGGLQTAVVIYDVSAGGRVLRGGSWNRTASVARSASRDRDAPEFRGGNVGCRPTRPIAND